MSQLSALIKRDTKLYFKDKGMFFTSLVTPLILLILYSTFLGNLFEESFREGMKDMADAVSDSLVNGFVGGQLASSILSVCCVTVAFCSNFLMVQDKVSGARKDLTISPVKRQTLALAYYISNLLSTLIVCIGAAAVCMVYLSQTGWYLTLSDILFILLDVVLLVVFGSALSSIINFFLSSQGQISAVGTIVSAGYGFICGAYMPISNFSDGLQKVLSFSPGTYGTSLLRNHFLRGVFDEMESLHIPSEAVDSVKNSVDCNISLLGENVEISTMYLILGCSAAALVLIYLLINVLTKNKKEN